MGVFVPPDEPVMLHASYFLEREILASASKFFIREQKLAWPQQKRLLTIACVGGLGLAALSSSPRRDSSVYILGMIGGAVVLLTCALAAWRFPSRLLAAWQQAYDKIPGLLGSHIVEVA